MPRRTRVMSRLWQATAGAVVAAGLVTPAAAADRGEVRIVAIAPADCRLAPAPASLRAYEAVRLACNTPNPAAVTVNVAGLGGAALIIDGKAVTVGPDGLAALTADQLASRADWRLAGGKPAAAPLELTIVAR